MIFDPTVLHYSEHLLAAPHNKTKRWLRWCIIISNLLQPLRKIPSSLLYSIIVATATPTTTLHKFVDTTFVSRYGRTSYSQNENIDIE